MIVIAACIALIGLTTVVHYEVLRVLHARLPALAIPGRTKLLVVMFGVLVGHAVEICVYGLAFYGLVHFLGAGGLTATEGATLTNCLYFSAETYTSLGFGDLVPTGGVRLLAGVEALNGLLLIGWSASYAYIAMERFWADGVPPRGRQR
jgi:hypothetical protein